MKTKMLRKNAKQIFLNYKEEFVPIIVEAKQKIHISYPKITNLILCDENIENHIISIICDVIDTNNISTIIDTVHSLLIDSLLTDIKHLKAKNRPIFNLSLIPDKRMINVDKPNMSKTDAKKLLYDNFTEIKPIILHIEDIAEKELPASEEKSITIPYALNECAIYAIQYADPKFSPSEAVKNNLYKEILKEIEYLKA